jgi:hypothetical protein
MVQRRERLVIRVGVSITAVALALTFVVLPFLRHWSARESDIAMLRSQADSLAGLVANAAQIESSAAAQEKSLSESTRRTLHARSAPLAASALQSLLQDASDASHLLVTKLDVAQTVAASGTSAAATSTLPAGTSTASSLPATLAAYCDVVGLAALLDHLAHAPRVVYVERVTVQQNSALRGAPDMLQVTLSVRAPVVLE